MLHLIEDYFTQFQNKNISALLDIYADDVQLLDWDTEISGKLDLINANEAFFKSCKDLSVTILRTLEDHSNRTVACEIQIAFDNVCLNVVDLISFNKEHKIDKIAAYRR